MEYATSILKELLTFNRQVCGDQNIHNLCFA
ncbi:hypothetical protein CEXT_649361, partial [Caerostris extrusa]